MPIRISTFDGNRQSTLCHQPEKPGGGSSRGRRWGEMLLSSSHTLALLHLLDKCIFHFIGCAASQPAEKGSSLTTTVPVLCLIMVSMMTSSPPRTLNPKAQATTSVTPEKRPNGTCELLASLNSCHISCHHQNLPITNVYEEPSTVLHSPHSKALD